MQRCFEGGFYDWNFNVEKYFSTLFSTLIKLLVLCDLYVFM